MIVYLVGWIPRETHVTTYNEQTHHQDTEVYDTTFYLIWKAFEGLNYIAPAIGSLAAIAAVAAAVWLARVTRDLHRATQNLATSTEDLAKGDREQVDEMKAARTLAEQQHALAKAQYLTAHRPRMKFRGCFIPLKHEDRFYLLVANGGDSVGTITNISCTFTYRRNGVQTFPNVGIVNPNIPISLAPAYTTRVTLDGDEEFRTSVIRPIVERLSTPDDTIYYALSVLVIYEDETGRNHRCSAHRELDPATGLMRRVADSDFDYED